MNHPSRRRVLAALGAMGFGAFAAPLQAGDAKTAPAPEQATGFAGAWTYRSFLNNPDIGVDFNKLEFARAGLLIHEAPFGVFSGRLTFGDDGLALKGNITYGNPFTARFEGRGDSAGTKGWVYNYLGFLVPAWPDGVNQRPAIVGSVIRTVAHGENSPAGVVASFIAVKRDGGK